MAHDSDDGSSTSPETDLHDDRFDTAVTAIEPSFDDDYHLPRDTAPLDRNTLDAIRAITDAEESGTTDEVELDGLSLDDATTDEIHTDTLKAPRVDE